MSDSARQIEHLLYRYAERMDAGDFDAAAALFVHARIRVRGSEALLDHAALLALWRQYVKLYPCGTPRTRHVVTNAMIEVNEAESSATSRSYYTVFQATEGFALQPVAAGRYHDEFVRIDGTWWFRFRDYSLLDLVGDLSRHLKQPVP